MHYGQSVILNVKTRRLYVKLCNATADARRADVDLKRFGLKKNATKTTLTGDPNAENNFDAQPISPRRESIRAQKRFNIELQPYSFVMLEYEL